MPASTIPTKSSSAIIFFLRDLITRGISPAALRDDFYAAGLKNHVRIEQVPKETEKRVVIYVDTAALTAVASLLAEKGLI